jgi:hypothetical protein
MTPPLGVVGEIAVVSIAIGSLCWALGFERAGKRALVFGIVLGIVGEALVRQGSVPLAWVCAHRASVALGVVGAAVLLALLRLAWSVKAGKGDAKMSKKRRVEGGP